MRPFTSNVKGRVLYNFDGFLLLDVLAIAVKIAANPMHNILLEITLGSRYAELVENLTYRIRLIRS